MEKPVRVRFMLKFAYSRQFLLQYTQLVTENATIGETVLRRVRWFRINPNDTRLDNHELRKHLKDKWAFSVTDDIRIVYEWVGKTTVRFLAIGGHSDVYIKK